MRKSKTFNITYNFFKPGARVITTSSARCPLQANDIYTVIECSEPEYAGDICTVYLKEYGYGVDSYYLKEVGK